MTLGGLALAIGILVDEATVEIENIHTQMEHTPSMSRAVRQGNMETAVPRLLGFVVHPLGVHPFVHHARGGAVVVRAALAGRRRVDGHVVLAFQHAGAGPEHLAAREPPRRTAAQKAGRGAAGVLRAVPEPVRDVVSWTVAHRCMVVLAYLIASGAVVVALGGQLGRELFPRVDAGQFQLRVRPSQGTHYELTRQVAQKTLDVIAEEAGPRTSTSRWATSARTRRSSPSTWPTSGAGDPTTACSGSAFARGARSTSSSSRRGCARSCRRRSALVPHRAPAARAHAADRRTGA